MRSTRLFRPLRALLTGLYGVPYRFRARRTDRIPETGPVVIAANHGSYWDPVFLQIACPRQIFWLMDEAHYRMPVLHHLFKAVGCIPVKDGGGNRAAVDAALGVLGEGGVVGIFPEGFISRTGRLAHFRTGVSTLAARAGAAVVPVYLRGAFFAWHKGQRFPRLSRVEARFAEPMRLQARGEIGREELQAFADRVKAVIRGMYGRVSV